MKRDETSVERLPVWRLLLEFFLDTAPTSDDLERIAQGLSRSPHSIRKLQDILRHEVYPPCSHNLSPAAGEWTGFDDEWLLEEVGPRLIRRPWFSLVKLDWWMVREQWQAVSSTIEKLRGEAAP